MRSLPQVPSCFVGVAYEEALTCCDQRFGPRGAEACWDSQFSFESCCSDCAGEYSLAMLFHFYRFLSDYPHEAAIECKMVIGMSLAGCQIESTICSNYFRQN